MDLAVSSTTSQVHLFSDPIYGGSMANPGLIDGIWGGSVPYHYNGLKSNMQWLELVAGVKCSNL